MTAEQTEYPWWQPYHDSHTLDRQYEVLLTATNCSDMACMRNLDYEVLANATALSYELGYESGVHGFGDFYYGPYVDGRFIKDFPSNEFEESHWSKVPILVDHDAFEGTSIPMGRLKQPNLRSIIRTHIQQQLDHYELGSNSHLRDGLSIK